jgi:hypothetical protein
MTPVKNKGQTNGNDGYVHGTSGFISKEVITLRQAGQTPQNPVAINS